MDGFSIKNKRLQINEKLKIFQTIVFVCLCDISWGYFSLKYAEILLITNMFLKMEEILTGTIHSMKS